MKIEKVIQPGERVSKSEMMKLFGGFGLMDNDNKAIFTCSCSGGGTADNSNRGLWCSCNCNSVIKPKPLLTSPNSGDTLKPILGKQN